MDDRADHPESATADLPLGSIPREQAWDVGEQLGWPPDVIYHVLVEHGHRQHLDDAFAGLDLTTIEWQLEALPASELVAATHHPDKTRVETVAVDPDACLRKYKDKGFEMWAGGTWAQPPFFIDGALVDPPRAGLYLVEGHNRLGLLTAFLNSGEVPAQSLHTCWLACPKKPTTVPATDIPT